MEGGQEAICGAFGVHYSACYSRCQQFVSQHFFLYAFNSPDVRESIMQYFCLVPCGQQTCQFANGILLEHQVTFNPVEHVVDMVPCWVVVFMRTKGNIICTLKGEMNGKDKAPSKKKERKKFPFQNKCKCLSNLKCTTTLQSDFKRNL